ncbi:PIN domain-like protein [Cutaneotrichosporon oleaginosum]|uniref:Exonuclease 1 n=1 Tax=Cutaneotrichosporon oleaginosum TaxID=879819 RepID=A0A0J0XWQ9_9TREE|nr:PIN domain-like protein [Cutaneotrichosporon oleaginosum]KLT45491.1 PIN domain-like protein [Cutaneotrichosporon oleaginosum]TXT14553.1 hypothetical protein COLE_00746 [Cutaneotrichosporon oleaginosum]
MGIKDLMKWVKKTYPEVVTEYPRRWAAPELRGKRVAIDATLLTNRFHFGEKNVHARAARGLLGWYTMIREMQANGVSPIAVWDERGERPWKAPEARRRLETRARNLARQLHEERRVSRVSQLREALVAQAEMGERERTVLAAAWEEGLLSTYPLPSSSTPVVELSDTLVAAALAVGSIAARTAELATLYEDYVVDSQPVLSLPFSNHPAADAIEEEEEEILRIAGDELPHAKAAVAAASLLEDEEGAAVLDARLRCLPAVEYTETPKQRDLTEREGEVFGRAFSDVALALRGLTEIEDRMPRVADIYERALAIPREENHAACRELLRRMGVPTIFARVPYEAEGLCAAMALSGMVDFAGTEDSDVVVYGGPLLRGLTATKEPLTLVDGAQLQDAVPLTPAAWRDFCILLGTDASPRIPLVGPTRAYKLIERWGSIEDILKHNPELAERVEPDFMDLVANARRVFTDLPPVESVPALKAQPEEEVAGWIREMGASVPPQWLWGAADERREMEVWNRGLEWRSRDREGVMADAGDYGASEWEDKEIEEPPPVPSWEEVR